MIIGDLKITDEEYPPKYEGIKENGDIKMVYRINEDNCEMGLVYNQINRNDCEYRWEHFINIQKYK